MPLKTNVGSPASLARAKDPARDASDEIEYAFRFITPMFGGGVEVKGPDKPFDPQTPIRVPSIRGQLRFWWRACNRVRATSIEELRDAEAKLWGSTSQPSAISIRVDDQPRPPARVQVFTEGRNGRWSAIHEHRKLAYAIFPLKPPEESTEQPGVLWRFKSEPITLSLRIPSAARNEVMEALQAWSLFGGLGGRTRRGFGAIERVTPADETTVEEFLASLNERPRIAEVPSLCGAKVAFAGSHKTSDEAWAEAVDALQRFRQGPGTGRAPINKQTKRPGRSYWPEADAIRVHAGHNAERHAPRDTADKFPRAAFGLPIIFHFSTRNDPNDATLTPADGLHRFASPLLLRPAKAGTKTYRSMAVMLANTAPPDDLTLSGKDRAQRPFSKQVTQHLRPSEARSIRPLGGVADPLESFLRYFATPSQNNTR